MDRESAKAYIGHVVDDALSGRKWGPADTLRETDRLIGWQCGFEPMFVVVRSAYDSPEAQDICGSDGDRFDAAEGEEIATDYLSEIGWFASTSSREPDYIL